MIRRIDRYVLRELSIPLLTGTIVIALLFVANDAIAIFKNFNLESVPPLAIFQLLAYRLPHWLSLTLPVGTAMGAALAVSRLARDSEVTAMRAAGYPMRRIVLTVALVGLAMSALDFWVVDSLVPRAAKSYRRLINSVGLIATAPRFQSNVTLQLDRYTCNFGTVRREGRDAVLLEDVLLVERPRPGEQIVYTAKRGIYRQGVWTFADPHGWWLKDRKLQFVEEGELTINEPIRIADLFGAPLPEEESTETLRRSIATTRASGGSTRELEIAFHQKFATAASCVVLALAGGWLSLRLARRGAFVGLFVSLGLAVAYFNAHVVSGEVFGRSGWVPPIWAAWLPVAIFGLVGLLVGRRME